MIANARPIRFFAFAALALALILPIAGCETKEKPPVIDVETPIKDPAAPKTNAVAPAAPSAR